MPTNEQNTTSIDRLDQQVKDLERQLSYIHNRAFGNGRDGEIKEARRKCHEESKQLREDTSKELEKMRSAIQVELSRLSGHVDNVRDRTGRLAVAIGVAAGATNGVLNSLF